jgi:hypothetical protein
LLPVFAAFSIAMRRRGAALLRGESLRRFLLKMDVFVQAMNPLDRPSQTYAIQHFGQATKFSQATNFEASC